MTIRTVLKLKGCQSSVQSVHCDHHRLPDRVVYRLVFLLLLIMAGAGNTYAADAIPGEQWCDRAVTHIRFVGNDVTRDHVIERELVQKPGDACSLDDIIDGIQNVLDLGLFKSVRAELHLNVQALELHYIVVEKIYFLPLPRVSRTSDGELRLGGQLRWDNFLGRLHQVKLTSEKRQENDGRGRAGYVHSLDYTVPRFFGSRYGMGVSLASERRNAELEQDGMVYGETLRTSRRLEWRLARWANDSESVLGLSYFAGIGIEHREYEMRSGTTGPYRDGQNVNLVAGYDIQNIHQDTYRRRGSHHSMVVRLADSVLGSDFRYVRIDAQMRWYIPLATLQTGPFSGAQSNLNIQWRLGLSSAAPFGERSYGIGGGDVLRGMRTGTETGNILTLLNVEYLSGFFSYPAWRWLAFTDIGNVYRDNKVNLSEQHVRLGTGLRWKLTAITNTDLRMDVAWDPRRRKFTPYVSTSVTF